MAKDREPVVLELAQPPREQLGPFLLLGLEKDAGPPQIEANWAKRIIWARKNLAKVPLEDINWAREVINDPERRVRADAASLNLDTSDRILSRLGRRYGDQAPGGPPRWQARDLEKPLQDLVPNGDVPSAAEALAAVAAPRVPAEVPAVLTLLAELAREPLDPWETNG